MVYNHNMKLKYPILIVGVAIVVLGGIVLYQLFPQRTRVHLTNESTTTTSVTYVSSNITADGVVTAQNQATLHFQMSGKLTYLPFKEGNTVNRGQTIASLDTYTIQKQLEAALNTYRSTRDTFDQTNDNIQNNVQKAQLTYPYNYYGRAGIDTNAQENVINNAVKRIIDQSQANLDNSVINVQIANNAFQLATLTSPLNGVLLHEDADVAGVNVTPANSFVIADPTTAVFRANITVSNINYIKVGARAQIAVDGISKKMAGVVTDIYPAKVTLPNGQAVYQVDIRSDELLKTAKLDQTGTAIIKTDAENVALIPVWTVLQGSYVWVDKNGVPKLKTVTTGKIHGQEIEILNGLTSDDRIITDPQFIQSLKYPHL